MLAHDFPIITEDHPLSLILKSYFDIFRNCKEEEFVGQGEFLRIYFLENNLTNKNLFKILNKLSDKGIIPKIVNSNSHLFEFSQQFYSSKFDGSIEGLANT